MLRIATALFLSVSTASLAQSTNSPAHHQQHGVMVNHGDVMQPGISVVPMQPGQAAFATIQEIVQILEADPRTDWAKVDIDALRQHLIDMNNVTLKASVQSAPVPGGIRFTAIGTGDVRELDTANGCRACRHNERYWRVDLLVRGCRRRSIPYSSCSGKRSAEAKGAWIYRRDDSRHASSRPPPDDCAGTASPRLEDGALPRTIEVQHGALVRFG